MAFNKAPTSHNEWLRRESDSNMRSTLNSDIANLNLDKNYMEQKISQKLRASNIKFSKAYKLSNQVSKNHSQATSKSGTAVSKSINLNKRSYYGDGDYTPNLA